VYGDDTNRSLRVQRLHNPSRHRQSGGQMKIRQHYVLSDYLHPKQRLVFAKLSLWRRFMRMFGK
jgi:hypothetical protein